MSKRGWTRRETLSLLGRTSLGLLLSQALPSPVLASTSGLERRILWEEIQRSVERLTSVRFANLANYAPPHDEYPAIYAITMCEIQGYMSYPTQRGEVLVPLEAQLFAALPPGYKGEDATDPRFPKGHMRVIPFSPYRYLESEEIKFPLQPLPNPFRDWDGLFLRKGRYMGEDYLFIAGRSSFPIFFIEKNEEDIVIKFYSFQGGDKFRGVIGVYRNGRLDETLSNSLSIEELPEEIRVKPIITASPDWDRTHFKGVYPIWRNGSIFSVQIRIPYAKRSEHITFAYVSNMRMTFPSEEEDLRDPVEYPLGLAGRIRWPAVLRLTMNPIEMSERIRITPKTTTYLSRTIPSKDDDLRIAGIFDDALKELDLKKKKDVHSYLAIAYPEPTYARGIRLSAVPERLL